MCWSLVLQELVVGFIKKSCIVVSERPASVAFALQVDEMEPILSAFRARLMWFRNLVW